MNLANVLSQHLFAHYDTTGDDNAFLELYNRHGKQVAEFVAAHFNADPASVENIVNETFDKVRATYRQYDATKPFSTWLCTLAGKVAINHRVRPNSRAQINETIEALNALPDSEYRAIISTFYLNLSERDSAKLVGVTRNELRTIRNSAFAKLNSEYRVSA